jgi:hypothetical protein
MSRTAPVVVTAIHAEPESPPMEISFCAAGFSSSGPISNPPICCSPVEP